MSSGAKTIGIFFLAAGLLAAAAPAGAQDCDLVVDDDFAADDEAAGEFTTIQAAVDEVFAAFGGDDCTITVRDGIYAESVIVKPRKIKGKTLNPAGIIIQDSDLDGAFAARVIEVF